MKNTKINKNATNIFHYLILSLFAVSSILLSILMLISYVYGIIKFCNKTDITNINNYNNFGAKFFTILLIIMLFIFVLAIVALCVYGLFKASLRCLDYIDNNNLIYFVFAKRWIDSIISICLGFVTFFGISYLFNFVIPWYNNSFSICIACVYWIVGIIFLSCNLYYTIWLNRQPSTFKNSFNNITSQIKNSKEEMKKLKESSNIKMINISTEKMVEDDNK